MPSQNTEITASMVSLVHDGLAAELTTDANGAAQEVVKHCKTPQLAEKPFECRLCGKVKSF